MEMKNKSKNLSNHFYMVIELDVLLYLNPVCIILFFYSIDPHHIPIGNGSDAGAASTIVKEHDKSNFVMNGTKAWMLVNKPQDLIKF
jgi:hypothetical protein